MFTNKDVKNVEKSILQDFDEFLLFQYTLRFVKDRHLVDYNELMVVASALKREAIKADTYLSDEEFLAVILDSVQLEQKIALPYHPYDESTIEAEKIISRVMSKYRAKIEENGLIVRSDYLLSDFSREVDLESVLMAWEDILNPDTRKERGLKGKYGTVGSSDIDCFGEHYEDATVIYDLGIYPPTLRPRPEKFEVKSDDDCVNFKIDSKLSSDELLWALCRVNYEINNLNRITTKLCLNLERGDGVIVDRYDNVQKRLIGLLCWDSYHLSGNASCAAKQVYDFLIRDERLPSRDEEVIKKYYYEVKGEIDQVETLQERKRACQYVGLNLSLHDRN